VRVVDLWNTLVLIAQLTREGHEPGLLTLVLSKVGNHEQELTIIITIEIRFVERGICP